MLENINKQWETLNKINREWDNLYHQVALKSNLSDSNFWVLYCLCSNEEGITQMDICYEWNFNKQTVNSAIKDLKTKGYIDLKYEEGNNKSKKIVLTEKGKEISKKVQEVIKVENIVANKTDEKQFEEVIHFFKEQLDLFKEEIKRII